MSYHNFINWPNQGPMTWEGANDRLQRQLGGSSSNWPSSVHSYYPDNWLYSGQTPGGTWTPGISIPFWGFGEGGATRSVPAGTNTLFGSATNSGVDSLGRPLPTGTGTNVEWLFPGITDLWGEGTEAWPAGVTHGPGHDWLEANLGITMPPVPGVFPGIREAANLGQGFVAASQWPDIINQGNISQSAFNNAIAGLPMTVNPEAGPYPGMFNSWEQQLRYLEYLNNSIESQASGSAAFDASTLGQAGGIYNAGMTWENPSYRLGSIGDLGRMDIYTGNTELSQYGLSAAATMLPNPLDYMMLEQMGGTTYDALPGYGYNPANADLLQQIYALSLQSPTAMNIEARAGIRGGLVNPTAAQIASGNPWSSDSGSLYQQAIRAAQQEEEDRQAALNPPMEGVSPAQSWMEAAQKFSGTQNLLDWGAVVSGYEDRNIGADWLTEDYEPLMAQDWDATYGTPTMKRGQRGSLNFWNPSPDRLGYTSPGILDVRAEERNWPWDLRAAQEKRQVNRQRIRAERQEALANPLGAVVPNILAGIGNT